MIIQAIRFFGGRNQSGIPGDVRKLHVPGGLAVAAFAVSCFLASAQALAQNAYILNVSPDNTDIATVINTLTNTVTTNIPIDSVYGESVTYSGAAVTPDGSKVYAASGTSPGFLYEIATATNTVIGPPIPIGNYPQGVAITPDGGKIYVTSGSGVSVINTDTNKVVNTLPVGTTPYGVAVTPDGSKVYVANINSNSVSVIDTATNMIIDTIPIVNPFGIAVTPDGSAVYVTNGANFFSNTVSVINTVTNNVITTINIIGGFAPRGVAVTPDGSKVYVANTASNNVAVINTKTNTVTIIIPVGSEPTGVAVTPDGSKIYVENILDGTVSVINTTTNMVADTIIVNSNGLLPFLGNFIQPTPKLPQPPTFSGISGQANCIGRSVSALAKQYGGFAHAAAALDYSSVPDLQMAVVDYCGG